MKADDPRAPDQPWWIVSRIRIRQCSGQWIVHAVENRGVPLDSRRLEQQPIDTAQHLTTLRADRRRKSPNGGMKRSSEQRSRHAFTGYVRHQQAKLAIVEGNEIVIITAYAPGGTADSCVVLTRSDALSEDAVVRCQADRSCRLCQRRDSDADRGGRRVLCPLASGRHGRSGHCIARRIARFSLQCRPQCAESARLSCAFSSSFLWRSPA
jgi:hypothetical protein